MATLHSFGIREVTQGTTLEAERCAWAKAELAILAAKIVCSILVFVVVATSTAASENLGSATFSAPFTACDPGGLAGTCYTATISGCPEQTKDFTAQIKIIPGDGMHPVVFFTSGEGGNAWYDHNSLFMKDSTCPVINGETNCGAALIQQLNALGYDAVVTSFSDDPLHAFTSTEPVGWATGPDDGSILTNGPRSLVCRYATLVEGTWNQF